MDHSTGRACEECQGNLNDVIVRFGESLPDNVLEMAKDRAGKATLSLVLGTSLLVAPANQLPLQNGPKATKLVIVNRQKTPFDHLCHIRIFADTDDVLLELSKLLCLDYPTETTDGYAVAVPEVEHGLKYERTMPELLARRKQEEQRYQPKRGQLALEKRSEEKIVVDGSFGLAPSTLLFVNDCSRVECEINSVCAKVILHRVKDSHVFLRGSILTSCLEVIECENVEFHFSKPVLTVTIDLSQRCLLVYQRTEDFCDVFSSASEGIAVVLESQEPMVIEPSSESLAVEPGDATPQFITRYLADSLTTELVVREGAGYATTAREKKAADEKQAALEQQLMRMLALPQ